VNAIAALHFAGTQLRRGAKEVDMQRLAGRICLITGASSGFGAHFARLAVGEGARVILGARRADRLAAQVAELGVGNALAAEMDVTCEASTIGAFDAAEADFGPVDTVIANAGVSVTGRATEIPAAALQGLFDTNLLGLYLTVREGARRMIAAGSRESGRGRILLVGSMGAHAPFPGGTAYWCDKVSTSMLSSQASFRPNWPAAGLIAKAARPR
jgi:NADP-dependent 3-hydroxy acid dehydrogenase YdfG